MNYLKALASRSLTSSEISKLQHREETSQIRVTECSLLHCLTFFDKHSSTTGLVQQEPATTSSTPSRCGISARQVLLYVISSNQQNRCHHKQQKLSNKLKTAWTPTNEVFQRIDGNFKEGHVTQPECLLIYNFFAAFSLEEDSNCLRLSMTSAILTIYC
jgi:hypothetical protein